MNNQPNQPGSSTPGDDSRTQNTGPSNADSSGAGINAGGGRKAGAAGGQARGAASQGALASAGSQLGDHGAHSSDNRPKQDEGQAGSEMLNTALESGKKWIEDSGVLTSASQLPQSVKDWSSRAATRVSDLTTTQKIVGGALLAVGIGYLATRKKSGKADKSQSRYGRQSSGSYGRSAGYQAPDTFNSRRGSVGSGRLDSGSAYGNSASGAGSTGSYGSGTGFGSAASGSDFGSRTSESSYRGKNDDFRSAE